MDLRTETALCLKGSLFLPGCTSSNAVGLPSERVSDVFLYYRLRASTVNANVPEPFFQTLKRHWDTVVERVAAFIDTLGHRAQP
jgi:hypothetical protein